MTEPNDNLNLPGVEKIDFDQAGRELLAALERRRARRRPGDDPLVITARAIAVNFKIRQHGGWESRRRGVRRLVEHLQDQGHEILAVPGTDGGYFLPSELFDFEKYSIERRRRGLGDLAAASAVKRSPEAAALGGQMGIPGVCPRPASAGIGR